LTLRSGLIPGILVLNTQSLSRLTTTDLILYSARNSLYKASTKLVPGAITNYIAPCYQDWIEAGGIQCAEDDFWIELWSEEAFSVYKDPYSDPHSQVQLINAWLKDYEEDKGEKHCANFTWRD
jgi:hypothetical protein